MLLERAVKILHDMTEMRSEVLSLEQNVQGLLRVSCLPAFARRYIVPLLDSLFERYPRLQVDLELTERLVDPVVDRIDAVVRVGHQPDSSLRSDEHTSELQSLMRISYAVFCLKKNKEKSQIH